MIKSEKKKIIAAEIILNDYRLSLAATLLLLAMPCGLVANFKAAALSQPGNSLQGILQDKRHFVQWKGKYWVNNN